MPRPAHCRSGRAQAPALAPALALALGLALPVWVGAPARAEARLVRSGSDETIKLAEVGEIKDSTRLVIRGIRGTLSVREGDAPVLRFRVRDLENQREPRPVDLVQDGDDLRIEPGPDTGPGPLLFEVEVMPGLPIALDVASSKLDVTGPSGRFQLRSKDSSISASNLAGPARLILDGGSLVLEGSRKQLELEGQRIEARLTDLSGSIRLDLDGSQVDLENVAGNLTADLRTTTLRAVKVGGEGTWLAKDGSLRVQELTGEATFALAANFLALEGIDGAVRVQTDGQVQFGNAEGTLFIESESGKIRGTGSRADLTVTGEGTTVELASIAGRTLIEGTDMAVQVLNSKAELTIETTTSRIEVYGSTAPLRVRNLGGELRISQQQGPIEVHANGPRVEVEWAALPDVDSSIENTGGEVLIVFPASGGCQVEAETASGAIEANIDGIRVSDDGTSATGTVGSAADAAWVRVTALGDVKLRGARTGR